MIAKCPPTLRELSCGKTTIRCGHDLADRLVEFVESPNSNKIAGRFERGGAWTDITADVLVVCRAAEFDRLNVKRWTS